MKVRFMQIINFYLFENSSVVWVCELESFWKKTKDFLEYELKHFRVRDWAFSSMRLSIFRVQDWAFSSVSAWAGYSVVRLWEPLYSTAME